MTTRPTIYLIAVGVDRPRGGDALRYAEHDACKITDAFIGQLGPVHPRDATLLLGRDATWANLDGVLARMQRQAPDFLIVFFSGHGNDSGIALADQSYAFSTLRRRLERIGARGTVLLLDSCGSGGFAKAAAALEGVGGIDTAWWPILLAAVPGTRVFMASTENGSTVEIDGVGGAYTDAIIRAMRLPVSGDLPSGQGSFVSDDLVSRRAASIMRQRGLRSTRTGTFGGFPLAVANARCVGSAEVVGLISLEGGSLDVVVLLHSRLLLPTRIVATATDAAGAQWEPQVVVVTPQTMIDSVRARFAIDVRGSKRAFLQLAIRGRCAIVWNVRVFDAEDRCLTDDSYNVAYAA
jgi:hypothetical protein